MITKFASSSSSSSAGAILQGAAIFVFGEIEFPFDGPGKKRRNYNTRESVKKNIFFLRCPLSCAAKCNVKLYTNPTNRQVCVHLYLLWWVQMVKDRWKSSMRGGGGKEERRGRRSGTTFPPFHRPPFSNSAHATAYRVHQKKVWYFFF